MDPLVAKPSLPPWKADKRTRERAMVEMKGGKEALPKVDCLLASKDLLGECGGEHLCQEETCLLLHGQRVRMRQKKANFQLLPAGDLPTGTCQNLMTPHLCYCHRFFRITKDGFSLFGIQRVNIVAMWTLLVSLSCKLSKPLLLQKN